MNRIVTMLALGAAALLGASIKASAADLQCSFNKTPYITVTPESAPVNYDISQTTQQLTAVKSDTVSPYAPGTITVTDGLRRDRPVISAQIGEALEIDQARQVFCMMYDRIDIKIHLQPTIFIARETPPGPCRDAIIEHEQKHVRVDREVMNEFAGKIGASVRNAVNEIGFVGPLNIDQRDQTQKFMTEHISSAIKSLELPLYTEMRRRQADVDSLQEYQRVNGICKH